LDAGLIYTQTILAGVAMIAAYIVGKIFKLKTEICLLLTVIAGGLVGGAGLGLFRDMAEGSATFLDIALIFVFATLFMNILKESGGINFLVKKIISGFHNKKILLLILLSLLKKLYCQLPNKHDHLLLKHDAFRLQHPACH